LTVAPAAPRLIDRGDLVAALDRAATRKVTIISAPAGSGKTSLLRAWAGRPGQPRQLAVLQVQRDQQDAQQFWLALLDAVRHVTGQTAARNCQQQHPTSTHRRWSTGCCRSSPTLGAASCWLLMISTS
jgi:ATP/maltotriose-dependent transcriptional regulator MalT